MENLQYNEEFNREKKASWMFYGSSSLKVSLGQRLLPVLLLEKSFTGPFTYLFCDREISYAQHI